MVGVAYYATLSKNDKQGGNKMDYTQLANLIFPDAKDISYYEEKYPERNLPEGAMVTRFAPSPTGFVHIGGLFGATVDRN